jgi:hypothetical protein
VASGVLIGFMLAAGGIAFKCLCKHFTHLIDVTQTVE